MTDEEKTALSGDLQNGKGDFFSDLLALLLENCSGNQKCCLDRNRYSFTTGNGRHKSTLSKCPIKVSKNPCRVSSKLFGSH